MTARQAVCLGVLVAAAFAAYANSLQGEFFFDDSGTVLGNPNLGRVWPLGDALSAPPRTTNSGRPLAQFSLSVNAALFGTAVPGFRAVNVLLHAACALLLFGVARRALLRLEGWRERAVPCAFALALAWAVHPLNSVLVNYIAQRCELQANLLLLLTLYAVARGADDGASRRAWHGLAATACALGVASKESAVVGPLLVLLYDRTFLRGSFAAALRGAPGLYAGLAASWLLAAGLLARGGTADGAQLGRVPWGPSEYLIAQADAVLLYLRLAVWPHPLCFDYGWPARSLSQNAPAFAVAAGLLLATLWALRRHPAAGFAGAWFFLLLAPSSSLMPLPDIAVEYRVCLALAGPFALLSAAALRALERLPPLRARIAGGALLLCVAGTLFAVTRQRNTVYRSALSVWEDSIAKQPRNARAHANAGVALAQRGDLARAAALLQRAVELDPASESVQMNAGAFLAMQGRPAEARPHFERALELAPQNPTHAFNLGNAWSDLRDSARAIAAYRRAIGLDPRHAGALLNLGIELVQLRQPGAALEFLDRAAAADPRSAAAQQMRGRALAALGRTAEAREAYRRAVELDPANAALRQEAGALR